MYAHVHRCVQREGASKGYRCDEGFKGWVVDKLVPAFRERLQGCVVISFNMCFLIVFGLFSCQTSGQQSL